MILNPTDKICEECEGTGVIPVERRTDGGTIAAICPKCDGDGKFDWIEQAIGKKRFIRNPDTCIIALTEPPSNPKEEDYYFDTTLKIPRIYRNKEWKTFDYFGENVGIKTRRS
jgi:hypothetical protein